MTDPAPPTSYIAAILYIVVCIVVYYLYCLLDYLVVQPYRRYLVLKRQHIRGPSFVPIIGNILTMRHYAQTDQILSMCRDLATKHGAVMQWMLGPFNVLQLSDPDYVLAAWKTQHSHYHKGIMAQSFIGPLLGPLSMVLVDEPIHGKNRKMLAPAFHYSHLQSMVSIMVDETNRAIDQLLAGASDGSSGGGGGGGSSGSSGGSSSGSSGGNGSSGSHGSSASGSVSDSSSGSEDGSSGGKAGLAGVAVCASGGVAVVEVHKLFTALSLSIIMSSSFGDSLQHIEDAQAVIYTALTSVLTLMQSRSLSMVSHTPFVRSLPILGKVESDRGKAAMEAVVMAMVRDRKAGRSHSLCDGADLLDRLLEARDPETGDTLDEEQIRSDAMTFVLAGHETTSSLMTWVMRDLIRRPHTFTQCRDEVERCTQGRPLTAQHLPELTLIDACIHESFRLRPPVPLISIQARDDHWLDPQVPGKPPIFVQRDVNVFGDIYSLHTSKELWGPTADEYDEQRWIKGSERYCKPKHAVAFNGFSVGPRSCIGSNFALMEAKVMTALMVQRCDWSLVAGQQDVVVQKLTTEPKGGLWAHVRAAQAKSVADAAAT